MTGWADRARAQYAVLIPQLEAIVAEEERALREIVASGDYDRVALGQRAYLHVLRKAALADARAEDRMLNPRPTSTGYGMFQFLDSTWGRPDPSDFGIGGGV